MYDPNGLRYTNEYLAQEYRNEAANAKYKLETQDSGKLSGRLIKIEIDQN